MPMPSLNELVSKKVAGIPVVYLGLAAVLILAIVAWKMKPTVTAPEAAEPEAAVEDPDYSGLETTGTVVVQQSQPEAADTEDETNDKWLRAGVDYLVNDRKMATVGEAQLALSTYLEGGDLSYDQGLLRDAVVGKLQLPPEGLPRVGVTSTAPAQKQFSNFPGKHTVKGGNDNTPAKLAVLYYGNGDFPHVDKIVAANTTLGRAAYNTGTVVSIPADQPMKFYTVTKTGPKKWSTVAAANGISVAVLQALNPNRNEPFTTGLKLRTG